MARLPLDSFKCAASASLFLSVAGQYVHHVCLQRHFGIDGDDNGTIDGVYVEPGWRRQYWGTRLIEALSEELREMGGRNPTVRIGAHQKAEKAFWASQGWRPAQQILSPQPWPPAPPSVKKLLRQFKKTELG